jgi:hypothetical protein
MDLQTTEDETGLKYPHGIAHVLGNYDNWSSKTNEDQMKLRSQRARAGIRCEGCGAVGHFRRTCPNCGPRVEKELKARTRPTILSVFKNGFSREFGLWSRCVLMLYDISSSTVVFFSLSHHFGSLGRPQPCPHTLVH